VKVAGLPYTDHQAEQIGRIFALWMTVYSGKFFLIKDVTQNLGLLFTRNT
jgi:hypothetical protein